MLQIHYGLNQPFCSAHTPSREPASPTAVFVVGSWIKLTNGKAVQAGVGDTGCEIVFEPNDKNATHVVPTIYGIYEASTDQFVGSIADGDYLKMGAGGQLVAEAVPATKTVLTLAQAIGAATAGSSLLRFKIV